MRLCDELKRRRVFRALIAYGIGAFAVLQIIEPVMHGLHWPDEVLSYVVVALAVQPRPSPRLDQREVGHKSPRIKVPTAQSHPTRPRMGWPSFRS